MTGRDPAAEAAQKALGVSTPLCPYPGSADLIALAAAREMAKPIQAKCEELQKMFSDAATDIAVGVRMALAQLAPLIYSDDELKDNQ